MTAPKQDPSLKEIITRHYPGLPYSKLPPSLQKDADKTVAQISAHISSILDRLEAKKESYQDDDKSVWAGTGYSHIEYIEAIPLSALEAERKKLGVGEEEAKSDEG